MLKNYAGLEHIYGHTNVSTILRALHQQGKCILGTNVKSASSLMIIAIDTNAANMLASNIAQVSTSLAVNWKLLVDYKLDLGENLEVHFCTPMAFVKRHQEMGRHFSLRDFDEFAISPITEEYLGKLWDFLTICGFKGMEAVTVKKDPYPHGIKVMSVSIMMYQQRVLESSKKPFNQGLIL